MSTLGVASTKKREKCMLGGKRSSSMHQSGFGASASPNRGGAVSSGASRVPKMTTHGPTRYQVLIPLDTPTAEVVVANAATAVESCNRGLVEAYSKLRVESVHKA